MAIKNIKIDEHKLIKYVEFTECYKDPSISVRKFLFLFILICISYFSKKWKSDIESEYTIRKIVETFLFMKKVENEDKGSKEDQEKMKADKELENCISDNCKEYRGK